MANYTVFFPLTRIPKAQQQGDTKSRFDKPTMPTTPTMDKPEYETESAVTSAIAQGKAVAFDAYEQAKKWQKHLKSLEAKKFFHNKPKPRANGSYNFRFFGSSH